MSAPPSPPPAIDGAREAFTLAPGIAHLNHGSFGAVPDAVQVRRRELLAEVEADPDRFYEMRALGDRIEATRRELAAFAGLDPEGTALVANATTGAAIALGSIAFEPGDEIVHTDHVYGAVRMAIGRLATDRGVVPREVAVALDATDADATEAVLTAVGERTRLVVLDFVASASARVLPVAAVHARLRELDVPLFVDAAHGPGFAASPPIGDIWTGNLHKWAFAPRATALLSVAPAWRDRIRAPVVSWQEPLGFPRRVEFPGVTDVTSWLAAPLGAGFITALGFDRVREHNAELAAYGQAVVAEALGADVATLPVPDVPVPMRIVPLPPGVAATPDEAAALRERIADELGIRVAVNAFGGRGLLRVSGQVYNRAEEYDRLAERLPALLARR